MADRSKVGAPGSSRARVDKLIEPLYTLSGSLEGGKINTYIPSEFRTETQYVDAVMADQSTEKVKGDQYARVNDEVFKVTAEEARRAYRAGTTLISMNKIVRGTAGETPMSISNVINPDRPGIDKAMINLLNNIPGASYERGWGSGYDAFPQRKIKVKK
jgi:hypothetical protein